MTEKRIRPKTVFHILHLLFLVLLLGGVIYRFLPKSNPTTHKNLQNISQPTYMIYYGELNEKLIAQAKQYDLVILHPKGGNITRDQVQEIQSAGTCVLGYLSIGEDLRTFGMTPEVMLMDRRFTGDRTGPRVDMREPGDSSLDRVSTLGLPSPGGNGYASYYLDDNDFDGKPDFNPNFGCAYTNIGDPVWYDELLGMMLDGVDGVSGIREILTTDYGRGLGCDGLFLDTIDTCAPNIYTDDSDPARTRFEWTAPGVSSFVERLKGDFPDKYVLQNRGVFFFNYMFPHFNCSPGKYIDFFMFESYMLNSDPTVLYHENFFAENKNIYASKLSAEANRPDGFKVLSLGYAEGPEEYQLKQTLLNTSTQGLDILLEDLDEAQNKAGFSHYITDGGLTLANDFVLNHQEADTEPPVWSTVHNEDINRKPRPRVGIGQVEAVSNGVVVSWDVAIDRSGVKYILYYQKKPFDFEADPNLTAVSSMELTPDVGEGYHYDAAPDTWPYQASVGGLEAGETYYFVIRARDRSDAGNEEKNTVVLSGVPLA